MTKETTKNNSQNLKNPTHYIGIGASAGGLEALEKLFKNMPDDTGMAFIIVQHLSPDYKSMMVELLSRKTKMEVLQIEDGMNVEANIVYLVPPKMNLSIYHSRLILTEQMRDTGLNLPIDIFFRSLAIDKGKNAIGIILSGTGSDGSLGVRAIKEHGGMVMVQDYKNAKFDGMPKSAIATGLVDYILDVGKMSDALVKYVKHPLVKQSAEEEQRTKEETDYVKILSLIRSNVGEDFSYYKPKTIIRRIERRISVNQIDDVDDYIQLLLHSKRECEILAKEFLIGVTQFFRDKEAYDLLNEKVIPKLFENKEPVSQIRIWCTACSTGEEAYSMAILCKEYMSKHNINADLKIFATDLDKVAIKYAGMAIYSESIVSDISKEYLDKYFIRKNENYQIRDSIRQMVIFSNHNVISDPPFSKIDLVSCRNLLIYFKSEMQEKVLGLFQYALLNGGYLFLGSSESLSGVSDAFEVISQRYKIFKYRDGQKAPLLSTILEVRKSQRDYINDPLLVLPNGKHSNQNKVNSLLFEKVINYFAPAGAIVDSNNTIIHLFKNMRKYLIFPEGKPSYNLIDIANPQLSMVLSNMLYKVRKEGKEVILRKVRFKEEEKISYLNLTASPIVIEKNDLEFIVVSIVEHKEIKNTAYEGVESDFDLNEQANERIKELEQEIQYRDENLQTTIEELETSNEELQATNEELVSSNEELQSTNEELQSVNEELYTVNSQYQEKIHELTTLNNDMNNLLANTNIGTLFLDIDLTVRKFTPEITKIINVLDIDIGRPFNHLTLNCDYKSIYADVNNVLDNLVIKENKIKANNNEWYLVRIQPYRHNDRSIHGVLITQINITALHRSEEKFSMLFKTIIHGVVYQNTNGKITSVNPAAEEILGLTKDQMMGLTSKDPKWKAIKESGEEFPGEEHPSMLALRTGEKIEGVIMGVFSPKTNSTKWIRINAIPLFKNGDKKPYSVYTTFEDITKRKKAENSLKETINELELSQKKYKMLFNSMTFGFAYHKIITNNKGIPADYEFIKVNDAFEKLTGLSAKQVIGKKISEILPDTEDFWIETYGKVALKNETFEFKQYSRALEKTFKVKAYSPETGYFVTIFEEVN